MQYIFTTNAMQFAIWHKCLTMKDYVDHYKYSLSTIHFDRPNNFTFLVAILVVGSEFGSLSK